MCCRKQEKGLVYIWDRLMKELLLQSLRERLQQHDCGQVSGPIRLEVDICFEAINCNEVNVFGGVHPGVILPLRIVNAQTINSNNCILLYFCYTIREKSSPRITKRHAFPVSHYTTTIFFFNLNYITEHTFDYFPYSIK